jgi:hypothetical protein
MIYLRAIHKPTSIEITPILGHEVGHTLGLRHDGGSYRRPHQ